MSKTGRQKPEEEEEKEKITDIDFLYWRLKQELAKVKQNSLKSAIEKDNTFSVQLSNLNSRFLSTLFYPFSIPSHLLYEKTALDPNCPEPVGHADISLLLRTTLFGVCCEAQHFPTSVP